MICTGIQRTMVLEYFNSISLYFKSNTIFLVKLGLYKNML